MALLFMEGFEQYNTPNDMLNSLYSAQSATPGKWFAWGGGGPAAIISSADFRTAQPGGTSKSILFNNGTGQYSSFTYPATTHIYYGFAFKIATLGSWISSISTQQTLVNPSFMTIGLGIAVNTDGSISVNNFQNSSALCTSPANTITAGVWYYVEVNAVYGASGSITIKIDGNQIATASGINTTCGVAATGWTYSCLGTNSGYATNYDDIYVCDNTTALNNNFLGPINIYTLFPNAAGSQTNMTPTGAANNWDCVNDTAPDATTYVSASAANLTDMYTLQSITANPQSIIAVSVTNYALKTDNGARLVQNILTNSSGTSQGPTTVLTANSYRWSQDLFLTQPDSSPWTLAALGSLQIGVKSNQ